MLSSLMRHPRRRTVSIGPQSEADAYEAIALRAHARRLSRDGTVVDAAAGNTPPSPPPPPPPSRRRLVFKTARAGHTAADEADADAEAGAQAEAHQDSDADAASAAAKDASRLLAHVHRPRVRYDVEVVAKLAVYAGIGWLSTAGVPVLFELVGLGMGVRPA